MDILRVGYIAVFAVSSLLCFLSIHKTPQIDNPDTKRGLIGLLVFSGGWAGAHVGRLAAPTANTKVTFYLIGLVFGFGSVGAWLYFCSAYTGHDYHRTTSIRQAALGLYIVVVSVKLTNPLHHQYFRTTFETEPFSHLVIELTTVHWVVTGLAYALSAVGFYLVYEMYRASNFDTRVLGGLVGLTALPVVFDLIGYASPGVIITLNYEPIGVALFAVGALYLVNDQFVAIPRFWRDQVIEELEEFVLLIDTDGLIRDYNRSAVRVFRSLSETVGVPLEETLPDLWDVIRAEESILTIPGDGEPRYYLVTTTPLESGETVVGRTIIGTDVTEVERQRRELQRQNEQFDDFAAAITHELRNAITILTGYLDRAGDEITSETSSERTTDFEDAREIIDRMSRVVEDLSMLARYGQTLEETSACDLATAANVAFSDIDSEELRLTVETTGVLQADRTRLEGLFKDAFRFASTNGADHVTVTLQETGFSITENGAPISSDRIERAFDYGDAVPSMEAGMALPNVRTLARVHGWTAEIDADYQDGVRIHIGDVTVVEKQISA